MDKRDKNGLEAAAEAILFSMGEPVSVSDMSKALELTESETVNLMERLTNSYSDRGIQIICFNDTYQMCTRAEYFELVGRIRHMPPKALLTRTLLETLAIIAYKGPITRNQIEQIRGVDASHAVNKLMEIGLITEAGRLDTPGRPILFRVSDEFLRHFGLEGLDCLPPLEDFESK